MNTLCTAVAVVVVLGIPSTGYADAPSVESAGENRGLERRAVYGTFALGSSHPFRPGQATPATELGVLVELARTAFAFSIHSEGGDMSRLEPTLTLLQLGGSWSPAIGDANRRYTRVGGGLFVAFDLSIRTGVSVELAHGLRTRVGELGAFAKWHSPWYPSWDENTHAARAGLTTGAELTSRWRWLFGRWQMGVIGGTRPFVLATVGAGWRWK